MKGERNESVKRLANHNRIGPSLTSVCRFVAIHICVPLT